MKLSFAHLIPVAASVVASLKTPVYAAVDMFLKIDGIKGESTVKGHEGEIDVLAWSWQLSQPGATSGGTGGATGKPVIRPISILKYTDAASTAIIGRLLNGQHAPTARLSVQKAGESGYDYIKVDLKDVIITSVSNGGSETDAALTEQVFLGFSEVCVTYTPQSPTGAPGAPQTTCWNLQTNTP